jgi:hypothetical protein
MKQEQKLREKAIADFKFNLGLALKNCEVLYKMAESADLLNDQFFLDWLDSLNEISVRH